MRPTLALLVVALGVAAHARADIPPAPVGLPGFGPGQPRVQCRDFDGRLGITNDEGECLVGWNGTGVPPDAGTGLYRIHPPPPELHPAPREVHVALPMAFYAALVAALLVGVAAIVRAVRKRPPPS